MTEDQRSELYSRLWHLRDRTDRRSGETHNRTTDEMVLELRDIIELILDGTETEEEARNKK